MESQWSQNSIYQIVASRTDSSMPRCVSSGRTCHRAPLTPYYTSTVIRTFSPRTIIRTKQAHTHDQSQSILMARKHISQLTSVWTRSPQSRKFEVVLQTPGAKRFKKCESGERAYDVEC